MPKASFNHRFFWRALAVLLGAAGLAWGVHWAQMRRHASGQLARADAAERDGDHKELLASLSRYLDFKPEDTPARARYGIALARHARTAAARQKALQVLATVLLRDSRQSEARAVAASLALDLGEPGDALRYLEPALEAFPQRADWHELHSRIREAAGQHLHAAASLQKVLELEPGNVPASARLAELLHSRLRQTGQAERVLDEMVKKASDRPAALVARARYRARHGQPEEAEADLKRAIEEDEKRAEARMELARLSAERGHLDEAAVQWRAAARLAPDDPEAWLSLAWTERERGDLPAAAAELEKGLERLKDHPGL
ncbi:MAG: tetratricopeptide repeat protein, partial [Gemmataceae bacterium]|nr:tetratricopeptide repeat protein [Gemmataceae bacterium]